MRVFYVNVSVCRWGLCVCDCVHKGSMCMLSYVGGVLFFMLLSMVCVLAHICDCACVFLAYMHTFVQIYIHAYTQTYMHTYKYTYIPIHINTYVRTYNTTYIHIYIYMYKYMHTYSNNILFNSNLCFVQVCSLNVAINQLNELPLPKTLTHLNLSENPLTLNFSDHKSLFHIMGDKDHLR